MSNTGSRRSGQPALRIYPACCAARRAEREAFIEHAERLFERDRLAPACRGTWTRSARWQSSATTATTTRTAPGRQLAAIIASGDRTAELRRITDPTLVIHGTADPLVRPSGGRATARAIPGAQLMKIEGMGHDLPRAIWPRLIDAICDQALLRPAAVGA